MENFPHVINWRVSRSSGGFLKHEYSSINGDV